MTYRILNAEPKDYSSEARAILNSLGELIDGPLSRNELAQRIAEVDVLIVRLEHQIDGVLLERAKRLKVIVTATTGLDHIDLAYAQTKHITVLSLRGEADFLQSIPATAEHTWALLLSLLRNIPAACASVRAGKWERDPFRGHDLSGKSLGILGLGRIGEKIARYGKAFGMRVIAFDPYKTKWLTGVERITSLTDLLHLSTILSIHVPLDEETRGMIGSAEVTALPAGAVLVNTARGEVVDEDALLQSLESGHLSGAALDVLCNERSPENKRSPLIQYARSHDNLLITPHIGGATVESMAATEIFMAQKLKSFLENEKKV